MAKYYFHFQEDGKLVPDEEGVDLPNLVSARGANGRTRTSGGSN
jgi:hypothetical protein